MNTTSFYRLVTSTHTRIQTVMTNRPAVTLNTRRRTSFYLFQSHVRTEQNDSDVIEKNQISYCNVISSSVLIRIRNASGHEALKNVSSVLKVMAEKISGKVIKCGGDESLVPSWTCRKQYYLLLMSLVGVACSVPVPCYVSSYNGLKCEKSHKGIPQVHHKGIRMDLGNYLRQSLLVTFVHQN